MREVTNNSSIMSKECYQRMIEEKKRVLGDRPLNVTETDGVQQVSVIRYTILINTFLFTAAW